MLQSQRISILRMSHQVTIHSKLMLQSLLTEQLVEAMTEWVLPVRGSTYCQNRLDLRGCLMHCTGVLCLDLHAQHPNLLAVGCYDGSVHVFDIRQKVWPLQEPLAVWLL